MVFTLGTLTGKNLCGVNDNSHPLSTGPDFRERMCAFKNSDTHGFLKLCVPLFYPMMFAGTETY